MKIKYVLLSLITGLYSIKTMAIPIDTLPITPKKMIVTVPVADVRRDPKAPDTTVKLPMCSADNPLQETQVLYGEHIIALEEADGWIRIQAMEQLKNRNGIWQGYPGWIRKDQAMAVKAFPAYNLVVTKQWTTIYDEKQNSPIMMVSIGTKLQGFSCNKEAWTVALHNGCKGRVLAADVYAITKTVNDDEKSMRKQAVANALSFENSYYSWGGRSATNKELLVSSVDCAGLTNLAFRAMGLDIGRDANDQYLQATAVKNGKAMQPGDLIFTTYTTTPGHINHVMMYLGNEQLFETLYVNKIDHARTISVTAKLGKSMAELTNGQELGDYIVHLGSFLGSKEVVNNLRAQALKTTYN